MLFCIFNAFIRPPWLAPSACEAAGTRGNLAAISKKPGSWGPFASAIQRIRLYTNE